MFEVGDYVVSANNGVCSIKEVTTLDLTGVDKKRMYYILKPIYMSGSTIYVPVDAAEISMRHILSKDEADELLDSIPKLSTLQIENEKAVEAQYKECVYSNDCSEWIRLLKTLHFRNKSRLEKGHKITAIDGRYYRIAEDNLCGELAVALDLGKEDVEKCILDKME